MAEAEVSGKHTGLRLVAEIPFPTAREAKIAYNSLKVDVELRRGGVVKILSCKENVLRAEFCAKETRLLRVSVNSFFDHLLLVTQTLDQFGGSP